MKPVSTMIVLQLSYTSRSLSVFSTADLYISCDSQHHGSLNICNTIRVPTFKMEEGSWSRWILIKPLCWGYVFCYRPHCLLPWQQTEISPSYTSPKCFSTQKPPSPPLSPNPPKLLCTSAAPSILWSLGNTQLISCRRAEWDLSRDKFRSVPRFFSLFKQYQFESEKLWQNYTICNRMNWAAFYYCITVARGSALTQLR